MRVFVTGSDVFLSIPTGSGKSLCYAVLPRVFDMLWGNDTPQSLVILISPALMKDQLRIAWLQFLFMALRRDITRMKFH